jgi:tripartite-type tricarboxylate transporter receptor subunit TctC
VPNVPAIAESAAMADYNVTTWYGVFSTAGVPKPVVAKLNAALNEILKEEAVREKLNKAGVAVQGSTPEAFGKFMADELVRWNKVREAAGIAQQ